MRRDGAGHPHRGKRCILLLRCSPADGPTCGAWRAIAERRLVRCLMTDCGRLRTCLTGALRDGKDSLPLMTSKEIETLLVRVLRETQETSGRDWSPLDGDSKPIGALDGFDSLNGVEVTVWIETELGCSLGVDSLFVNENGTRALTIAEMVQRVERLMTGKGPTK